MDKRLRNVIWMMLVECEFFQFNEQMVKNFHLDCAPESETVGD